MKLPSPQREAGCIGHVDHIQPLSQGGKHHPDNLQILTAEENLRKGAKWEALMAAFLFSLSMSLIATAACGTVLGFALYAFTEWAKEGPNSQAFLPVLYRLLHPLLGGAEQMNQALHPGRFFIA